MMAASGRPWWSLPACQALLIQCVAAITTLIVFLLAAMSGWHLPVLAFLSLQGAFAAIASRQRRLARWWWYIQFCFPFAFWIVDSMRLPSGFFLAGFFFLVLLFWTTFRTQVPFYPSRRAAWRVVQDVLPSDRPIKLLDAGSGMGGMLLYLAGCRPDAHFVGVEAAPLPWLISRLRACIGPDNSRFLFGDYQRLDFSAYDVLFVYLSPAAMSALWQKACAEMSPGSLLLSYEFSIPEMTSSIEWVPETDGPILYGWYM